MEIEAPVAEVLAEVATRVLGGTANKMSFLSFAPISMKSRI